MMDSVEFSEKARRNFVGEAETWDRLTMQFIKR